MNLEERVKLYQQAQEIMLEEYPVIPTLHREILNAKRSYVKGFNNNRTFESHILKDVYFEF
jgi:ABC-type transport system substrate-binding protein